MIFLLLAIICSGSIALIFKYNENNGVNRLVVTSSNYLTAVFITFIISIHKTGKIISNINLNITMLAIITGFLYFITFIIYQKSIKKYGASLTGVFGRLGIFLPLILSLIFWKEYPTFFQTIGIFGAIISIFITNYTPNIHPLKNIKLLLILLLIFGGLGDFANKLFQKYGNVTYKESFLSILFLSALIFSLVYSYKKVKKIEKKDVLLGFAVGVPNLFSSFFLILALNNLKASLVFPLFSIGSLLMIILLSSIIFKEKLQNKDYVALILTTISLIFLNI